MHRDLKLDNILVTKSGTAKLLNLKLAVNYSFEVAFSRDAPLGLKIMNEKTVRYASEKNAAPVELLEARPLAVGPGSDRAEEYSTQRAIAAKLPAWSFWVINRLKGSVPPSAGEVQAAVKSRLQAQKPAASDPYETVDSSLSIPMGQSANIPTKLFAAGEFPSPRRPSAR